MRSTSYYVRHQFFVQLISKGSWEVQFGIHVKLRDVLYRTDKTQHKYLLVSFGVSVQHFQKQARGRSGPRLYCTSICFYLVSIVQTTYEFNGSEVCPATHKYAFLTKHLQKTDTNRQLRT
jgi:hypothetical protein